MGISNKFIRNAVTFSLLTTSSLVFAQDPSQAQPLPDQEQGPARPGGWRRVADSPQNQQLPPDQNNSQPRWQDPNQQPPQANGPQNYQGPPPPPPQLIIKPGTFITIRVNQPLSSDHNQPGDAFTASLSRPLVVDGVVVAQRGQMVAGRVTEAQKAGRVEGTSKLGIQLTELTLVDGQQVALQSQMINRSGDTSVGRDVGAVAGTTAAGAAVGAAAGWGRGAGIGAGAGAIVGLAGVLLTRGHPTVIYPETELTYRIEAPITISTERAPDAFRYVDPNEYSDQGGYQTRSRPMMGPQGAGCGPYGCPPPAPYYAAPYAPYPYYYGPSFAYYYGPRFHYGPGFYGRGYYRGYRR